MNKFLSAKSYAKLNLYLEISGKREDGYHLLRSVMQSVSLCDKLDFELSDGEGIYIESNVNNIPLDKSNLIWKSIEAFYSAVNVQRYKVSVKLEKNIPSMAGMAGGSSNAAAALLSMNKFYDNPLTVEELCKIAARLGADIPFCITGGTVLCEGIGDVMTKITSVPDCFFVVVKPDISISTPQAYKAFDRMTLTVKPNYAEFFNALNSRDIREVSKNMYNSLEVACDLHEINQIKEKLRSLGATNAMMTGSGSAVFGVFDDTQKAQNALKSLDCYPFFGLYYPVNKGVEFVNV